MQIKLDEGIILTVLLKRCAHLFACATVELRLMLSVVHNVIYRRRTCFFCCF